MNKILAALAPILFSVAAIGQTNAEAKALLEEVKQNLMSYSDQSFDFTNVIEIPTQNPDNPKMTRESSGSVMVVGQNYKINFQGQTIILNDNRAYVVTPDDEEVTVRILEEEDMVFTPNGILAKFEHNASLALAGKETIDGVEIQYVRVRPNGSEEIRDIMLGIDMRTKRIYSYTEYQTNDVVTKYTLSNYRVNQNIGAEEVRFNRADYEGWRINEPRSRRR